LIDKMKVDPRLREVERGYWTELERIITAEQNPDSELIGHILQSFREFFSKTVV